MNAVFGLLVLLGCSFFHEISTQTQAQAQAQQPNFFGRPSRWGGWGNWNAWSQFNNNPAVPSASDFAQLYNQYVSQFSYLNPCNQYPTMCQWLPVYVPPVQPATTQSPQQGAARQAGVPSQSNGWADWFRWNAWNSINNNNQNLPSASDFAQAYNTYVTQYSYFNPC